MTTTDRDLRDYVLASIGNAGAFDVTGIVDQIIREFGTTNGDDVPAERYWEIVAAHDTEATRSQGR